MELPVTAKSTVDELLAARPQAAALLLRHRTSCVGCHLARFCTLEDVARIYELSLPDLVASVRPSTDATRSRNEE